MLLPAKKVRPARPIIRVLTGQFIKPGPRGAASERRSPVFQFARRLGRVREDIVRDAARIDCLLSWDAPGDEPAAAYGRLRSHPRYRAAVQTFAHNMLAQAEADPALDGILKDAGRNVAAKCLAYLHVTGGLTLPRLKALCASIGLVSPGRARALLLYLRYVGYVRLSPVRRVGAPAQYLPTDRFLKTWRNHMRAMLQAAAAIEVAAGFVLRDLDVAGVFETFVRCISEGYLEGLRNIDPDSPFFRVFMHSCAGTQLVHLLVTEAPEVFPPQQPFALSISAAARCFGVSRTHIRRMLVAAEREGLLRLETNGVIRLQPSGREAIDHIYA
ncbi:MAG: hypothetical protein ACREEI_12045, partial [Stellaceae bacterium]